MVENENMYFVEVKVIVKCYDYWKYFRIIRINLGFYVNVLIIIIVLLLIFNSENLKIFYYILGILL